MLCFVGKRKNIRKLISKDKLAEETKVAQREEKERLERLKKKEQDGDGDSDERIILEQKPETKEVLLEVSISLDMLVYFCILLVNLDYLSICLDSICLSL